MKFFRKLFCKHNKRTEAGRYYTASYSYYNVCYTIRAHKVFQCVTCDKVSDEVVLEKHYFFEDDAVKECKRLVLLGYLDYDDYITR